MTGFRLVRPPPRLQWRYRSGFAPDSLFFHEAQNSFKDTKMVIYFPDNHSTFLISCQSEIRDKTLVGRLGLLGEAL